MHDAVEVVIGITAVHISGAVIGRACVGRTVRCILSSHTACDVPPMDLQVRTVTVIPCGGIRALLLVVHAKSVADLVDHIPLMTHVAAPAQVDARPKRTPTHTQHAAGSGIVLVDLDARARRFLRMLDEVDACMTPPHLRRSTEGFLASIVHASHEPVVNDRILLPHVIRGVRCGGGAAQPGTPARAAIVRIATPIIALRAPPPPRRALDRCFRQQGRLRLTIFFNQLVDHTASHDSVSVLEIALQEGPELSRHAPALEVPLVAPHLQGASCVALLEHRPDGAGAELEAWPRRLLMPDCLVQGGSSAPARGALENAKDVQALREAVAVALRRRHARLA
mmetsp:Transcript_124732/g.266162  ORF Transcript_124732/g.266162 Transcript_124732/m.266162 type:complete len:338 (+) Transcript_124732:546-1559(+)